MHSDSSSDSLPGIGALIATQERKYDVQNTQRKSTGNGLPIMNLRKIARNKGKRSYPPPQIFLPPVPSESPVKRHCRDSSPEQHGSHPPTRPRKRRKFRDPKAGFRDKAPSPIELTSSDEESKRRIAGANSKGVRTPHKLVSGEIIDLCSDPEDQVKVPKHTQNQPPREEDVITLLTTDDEESKRPAVDRADCSTPTRRSTATSGSGRRYDPLQSTPAMESPARRGDNSSSVSSSSFLELPRSSMPLQEIYDEALRKAQSNEESNVTCRAFSNGNRMGSQGHYNKTHHFGIFDPTSSQPPLLTPTFFMQMRRNCMVRQAPTAAEVGDAYDTPTSEALHPEVRSSPITSISAQVLQPLPSCLTQPEMLPAQESLEGATLAELSTPVMADTPRAVTRMLESEVPSLSPRVGPVHPMPFREATTCTPIKQQVQATCSTTTDNSAAAGFSHSTHSQLSEHQWEDNVPREAEVLEYQLTVRVSNSPDDLNEILAMLLPKDVESDDDLGEQDADLLRFDLTYPEP